ncbi:MAG: LacI family DNA-binding transcriptional regulator, partial [Spirochaetota bacterium]
MIILSMINFILFIPMQYFSFLEYFCLFLSPIFLSLQIFSITYIILLKIAIFCCRKKPFDILSKRENRMKKVSLTDIAQAAGVSISTVSRIVNNSAGIAEKTRTHVLEVMREKGYHPRHFSGGESSRP